MRVMWMLSVLSIAVSGFLSGSVAMAQNQSITPSGSNGTVTQDNSTTTQDQTVSSTQNQTINGTQVNNSYINPHGAGASQTSGSQSIERDGRDPHDPNHAIHPVTQAEVDLLRSDRVDRAAEQRQNFNDRVSDIQRAENERLTGSSFAGRTSGIGSANNDANPLARNTDGRVVRPVTGPAANVQLAAPAANVAATATIDPAAPTNAQLYGTGNLPDGLDAQGRFPVQHYDGHGEHGDGHGQSGYHVRP